MAGRRTRPQTALGITVGLMLSFTSAVCTAEDITVKAHVDKTVVGLNQQFTLMVELSGKDINSASNPQLPKMDNFAAYLGSGTSQNIQFINGKMSVSKTINYYFQATAVGKFQIGPVIVKAGGKEFRTEPISIDIQKTSAQAAPSRQPGTPQDTGPAEDDLFVRALADRRQVYQNEPVTITYKVYTRVNVTSFGFSRLPSTAGFWVEDFPMDGNPTTSTEVLEGKQYTVATIKKMAVFPMTPGKKTIDPMTIECEVRTRRRTRDLFNDFFSDPFGRSVRKSVQSNALTIDVRPMPEEGKPADFSGVVGRFKLNGSVDKTRVKTNEAISYKITVEGQGNIRTLPEPDVSFPPDFEVYPPKSSESINRRGSVISGKKTYEYVLVPRMPGQRRIKPVQLSVFNPASKAYETLRTDETVIEVAKGDDTFIAAPSGLSKEEVRLLGQDIRFIKTAMPSFRRIGGGVFQNVLLWMFFTMPLLLAGGAVAYGRHLDRLHGDEAYARNRRAGHAAKKRLSVAKSFLNTQTQKEFYSEVGKALTGYVADKLNVSEAGIMTEDIRCTLQKRGVEKGVVEDYFACLNECDYRRFAPSDATDAEMKAFLQKAETAMVALHQNISR